MSTSQPSVKDFNDGKYGDHFGSMLLRAQERPTPPEAADHVIRLMVRIQSLEEEVKRAKHEAKCAHQQVDTFAIEVSNLAHKRRPFNSAS